jgi:hypothetical protein
MMLRITPAPREALLGTALVALLACAAWPWARWAVHAGDRPPPAQAAAPAAAPRLPALEAFADIAARPLFTPNRRAATTAAAPLGLRLEGVLVMGAEKRAIIKSADGHTARLGEGDTVGEWTVRTIEPDRVLLVAGERRLELTPRRAGQR